MMTFILEHFVHLFLLPAVDLMQKLEEMLLSAPVPPSPGDTPDCELQLIPSWIVFSSEDSYKNPQYSHFKVKNNDLVPVVYRIRTKDRSFPRFSICHGYLEPNEVDEITIVIPAAENWPRDPVEYAGRRHKVVVENLTAPPNTEKPQKKDASALAMSVFKATPPLTRMYTKLNILLPRVLEGKNPENSGDI